MKKGKMTNTGKISIRAIGFAIAAAILVQLILSAAAVMLILKGGIAESRQELLSVLIQCIGVAVSVIIAFLSGTEHRFSNAAVAAAGVVLIPVLIGMLFWRVVLKDIILHAVLAAVLYAVLTWGLSRVKAKRTGKWTKFRNC